jgi:hypothetical protein
MEILFESTKEFEQELTTFRHEEQKLIIEHINKAGQLFLTNKRDLLRKLRRLQKVNLINDYESTLYSLKVNESIRLILTVDEDPIFEQVIFTLFRVVKKSLASKVYQTVAQLIYADLRIKTNPMPASM